MWFGGGKSMIVSTTNTLEGMKIVKTIGAIDAKSSSLSFDEVKSARKNLEKKAEKLGANAIINLKYDKTTPLVGALYAYGTAVIVE